MQRPAPAARISRRIPKLICLKALAISTQKRGSLFAKSEKIKNYIIFSHKNLSILTSVAIFKTDIDERTIEVIFPNPIEETIETPLTTHSEQLTPLFDNQIEMIF